MHTHTLTHTQRRSDGQTGGGEWVFVCGTRYIVCCFIKIPAGVIYGARKQACEFSPPNKTLAFFNRHAQTRTQAHRGRASAPRRQIIMGHVWVSFASWQWIRAILCSVGRGYRLEVGWTHCWVLGLLSALLGNIQLSPFKLKPHYRLWNKRYKPIYCTYTVLVIIRIKMMCGLSFIFILHISI